MAKKSLWWGELEYLADEYSIGNDYGVITSGQIAAYLVRMGYAMRLKEFHIVKAYRITPAGAEAIGRGDLFPLYDVYKTYRKIAWDGGYTALSYEDWYKVQPESGRAELAEAAPGNTKRPRSLLDGLAELDYNERQALIDELAAKLARAEAALDAIYREAVKDVDEYGYAGFCELIAKIALEAGKEE